MVTEVRESSVHCTPDNGNTWNMTYTDAYNKELVISFSSFIYMNHS